jgi:tetratricopeptide (TPR) repeat protein
VAEFVPTGDADEIAPIVSQRIYSFLDGQYKLSSFADVQVAHNKIGRVHDAQEARDLAGKINAHALIYGDVAMVSDQAMITPQFYIVDAHRSNVGEINGQHKLAARIGLSVQDLVDPSSASLNRIEQNTGILIEFTKALVYLAARTPKDLALARISIQNAIDEGERGERFEGQEVLYLFASDIARRQKEYEQAQAYLNQAMALNKNYGRGHIAQGNIYYDRDDLYQASRFYQQAIDRGDKPLGAYVLEKARLGLGNVCLVQYQYVRGNPDADPAEVAALAECALGHYQAVITSYATQAEPEDLLTEMTAGAYHSSGIVYRGADQIEAARLVYEQARHLTQDTAMQTRIAIELDEIEVP